MCDHGYATLLSDHITMLKQRCFARRDEHIAQGTVSCYKLEETDLDRGQTDHISLIPDTDLGPMTYNSLRAMVMTYS